MTDTEHESFCVEQIEWLRKYAADHGVAAAHDIAKVNKGTAWGKAWLSRHEAVHAPQIEYDNFIAKRSSELGLDTTATIRKLHRDNDPQYREATRATINADALSRTPIELATAPEPDVEPIAAAVADQQLDALAKAHAAQHGVSFAKAYREIMATDEGRAIYGRGVR